MQFRTFAIAALAAAAVPAVAAADTRVVVEKNAKFERTFENAEECSFAFSEHYSIRRTIVEVYDDAGDLIREEIHVLFKGTATNEATGASLPVNGTRNIVADYEAGTWTETGVLRHVTRSGEGVILLDAGRIVEDLEDEAVVHFSAGPKDLRSGDMTAFCAALADA